MQAIIMAAGKGSRLGELTGGRPKSFAEIKGKKLIEYNIRLLQKCGVSEIIIVTGYRREDFEELVKDIEGITLVWNPFYELVNVLGSFYMGMEYLKEDFLYLHADTLCDVMIMKEMLECQGDIILPVDYKSCDEEAMKVKTRDGKLTRISKLIPPGEAEGEFIGIARFKAHTIEALKDKVREVLAEKEYQSYFEGALQKLAEEDRFSICCLPTEGRFWAEIDFPEDYLYASQNLPDSLAEL